MIERENERESDGVKGTSLRSQTNLLLANALIPNFFVSKEPDANASPPYCQGDQLGPVEKHDLLVDPSEEIF